MTAKGNTDGPQKKPIGFRHLQVVFWFLAMTLGFIYKVNISMALVAMTDSTKEDAFDWSVSSQSTILSSFMWAYVISQFPGGELAAKFGGKLLLVLCISSNVIVSFLTPTCAYYGGWQLVCVCRAIQGFGQGVLMPCMHNLIGKWVPLEEKSRLGTFVYVGGHFGMGLQNFVSGYIVSRWDWPAIFYVNAVVGIVWLIPFIIFGSDSPYTSRWLSKEEKDYILTSLGQTGVQKKLRTPWKKMWTSMAFISLIVANCAQNWGLWTLMTLMPMYLSQVQGVDIKSNGLMSAIPYLGILIMSFPFGYIADLVIEKKWMSLTVTRKIFNSIGHIDMAPNFAGTMSGITNGFANVLSIFAPLAAGFILKDETNPDDWRKVFYLSSGLYIGCNIFYIIFGSSKRQKWNEPEEEKSDPVI